LFLSNQYLYISTESAETGYRWSRSEIHSIILGRTAAFENNRNAAGVDGARCFTIIFNNGEEAHLSAENMALRDRIVTELQAFHQQVVSPLPTNGQDHVMLGELDGGATTNGAAASGSGTPRFAQLPSMMHMYPIIGNVQGSAEAEPSMMKAGGSPVQWSEHSQNSRFSDSGVLPDVDMSQHKGKTVTFRDTDGDESEDNGTRLEQLESEMRQLRSK
jgi:hypothetical protein